MYRTKLVYNVINYWLDCARRFMYGTCVNTQPIPREISVAKEEQREYRSHEREHRDSPRPRGRAAEKKRNTQLAEMLVIVFIYVYILHRDASK